MNHSTMSLITRYKLNDLSTLLVDDTGNGHDLVNISNTGIITDATYGTVANFNGTDNRLRIPVAPASIVGASSHTFSFWMKLNEGIPDYPMVYSQYTSVTYRFQITQHPKLYDIGGGADVIANLTTQDVHQWNYYTNTYDGTLKTIYIQGVQVAQGAAAVDRPAGIFQIGGTAFYPTQYGVIGQILDFRIYDYSLSPSEVTEHFNDGPNIILPFTADPSVSSVTVSILPITGATSYQLTYEGPTGGEIAAFSGVTGLEHDITGLDPETQYIVKLYADTGSGYVLTEELTTTTLPNVAASYDITDFQDTNGVTDLTSLDITTLSNIVEVVTELVDTGDVVNVSVEGNDLATSFVESAGIINLADVDGLLLPFDTTSGAGQTIDLTLSDNTTTVPITYDDVNNTISVESTSYTTGDTFYLDGNKLEVFDYYGLTVVSVDVAPLLVEPSPINIPMVIAEVPGAIGYKIVYVNPSGVEITSTGTDLERNITGLVPDTEYVIKLYADTGSGYVLTEELTTTTLPNVAANYVVADLVEDGVINLSSLPEATISNITEVMNELFNTGDIVNVSVMGKPELNTSFINLEDILSIEELDGVLLPFVQASSTGQKVRVRLSDGSTDVDVNFDETENTITVNDTTYSPGDSFILDGKKVTVVEY